MRLAPITAAFSRWVLERNVATAAPKPRYPSRFGDELLANACEPALLSTYLSRQCRRMARLKQTSRTGFAGRRGRTARVRWRDVLSLCLLTLFALQGVIAQGHTHTRSAGAGVIVFGNLLVANTDEGAGNGGAPSAPDSANCGLCQSLSVGTAPLAVAILFLLPPAPEAGPEPRFAGAPVFTVQTVSYFWTSRGPPLSTPLHA